VGLTPARQVEAEELYELSERHDVPSVPFFLFFQARRAAPAGESAAR